MTSIKKTTPATKTYGDITIKQLPESQIEITGAIPAAIFDSHRKKALENINKTIKIDGYRNGNVPEKILVSKVGEKTVLEEMAEIALSRAYPSIVIDNKLDPISRPEISITKIAPGNPLEFTIKATVMPEIRIGDYKKIAAATPARPATEAEVSEKEVEEALVRIQKSHEEESAGDHKGHDHSGFDTPEFKEKIKEALVSDKERISREKRRIEMADKIADASTIELPKVLIESELRRIEAQFSEDITRMGTTIKDYLDHAKKTVEDLRKEWRPHAEKKVKLQLVLNKIAEDEKISVEQKEIDEEVNHILEHYKDADRQKAAVYAAGVLGNEKVFQFLEKQSVK
ncbi:MAG: trigger factor [bacterium]